MSGRVGEIFNAQPALEIYLEHTLMYKKVGV